MELQKGSVIRSKAGHDKGQYFAVIEDFGDYVLICDGKQRPLEKPKRKNTLHIAVTKTILASEQMQTDKGLRKALKSFNDIDAITSLKGGV